MKVPSADAPVFESRPPLGQERWFQIQGCSSEKDSYQPKVLKSIAWESKAETQGLIPNQSKKGQCSRTKITKMDLGFFCQVFPPEV